MTPISLAGSRPATAVLVQSRYFQCNTSVELHRWLHVNITKTGRSRLSISSPVLLDPIGPHRLPHPPRPNRHNARRQPRPSLPAISSLGGFRTPAPKSRNSSRRPSSAGIRKPSQKQNVSAQTDAPTAVVFRCHGEHEAGKAGFDCVPIHSDAGSRNSASASLIIPTLCCKCSRRICPSRAPSRA